MKTARKTGQICNDAVAQLLLEPLLLPEVEFDPLDAAWLLDELGFELVLFGELW